MCESASIDVCCPTVGHVRAQHATDNAAVRAIMLLSSVGESKTREAKQLQGVCMYSESPTLREAFAITSRPRDVDTAAAAVVACLEPSTSLAPPVPTRQAPKCPNAPKRAAPTYRLLPGLIPDGGLHGKVDVFCYVPLCCSCCE
jgi:hypothetical protein